jgi:ribose/xylose/arabinose/galactoside ABC-type transport system permease subunit
MYFYFYSWVTKILALFIMGLDIHMIANNKDTIMMFGDDNFSKLTIPQALMAVYGLFVAILLMCLTGYHTGAIGGNETTQEDIRDKYETWGGNPYNMGQWSKQNLYYALIQ